MSLTLMFLSTLSPLLIYLHNLHQLTVLSPTRIFVLQVLLLRWKHERTPNKKTLEILDDLYERVYREQLKGAYESIEEYTKEFVSEICSDTTKLCGEEMNGMVELEIDSRVCVKMSSVFRDFVKWMKRAVYSFD
jgi:hypothetical protein